MGLDVALGILVLIAAIRGWLQGFVHQAVRIAGLIACMYLADPVRDNAKPHVLPYLPTIQPELVDRLLWWVSAAVSYAVLVGVTTLVIKMTRRPEIPGLDRSSRNDQFAGFLLGAGKGVLIAAFMTAGIQKYALNQITTINWAAEQVKSSWALRWNEQYQPAAKIWSSTPVRHFVNHIQRMGLQNPAESVPSEPGEKVAERPVVETASRPAGLADARSQQATVARPSSPAISPSRTLPKSEILDLEVEKAVEEIKARLDATAQRPN
jgi:uncharacterized membrane protein required for colicin V production